jgi:hypothetical protein
MIALLFFVMEMPTEVLKNRRHLARKSLYAVTIIPLLGSTVCIQQMPLGVYQ